MSYVKDFNKGLRTIATSSPGILNSTIRYMRSLRSVYEGL